MRDPAFFDHLLHLIDLESTAERERHASLRAGFSVAERAARGLCLVDLEAVEEGAGMGGRILVALERADHRPLPRAAGFGPGEPVELAQRKTETPEWVRAIVVRRDEQRLTVAFERPPPPFVSEARLIVETSVSEVTYQRARDAVRQVKGLDRGPAQRRREVLLGNEPPRFDTPTASPSSAIALNPEQEEAVRRAMAARDLFLVHGPPGTGKSTVLVEVASQAVARGERVLCTAASNTAVDNLLDLCIRRGLRAVRVGHPARIAERLHAHSLDVLVEQHPDRVIARDLTDEAYDLLGYARRQRHRGRSQERHQNARDAQAEARRLLAEARALERRAVRAILDTADVLCATCAALCGHELSHERFQLALVDESTQAIEPIAYLPFLRAERMVLFGDPFQLPPTVRSMEAARAGLARSLFERLLAEHSMVSAAASVLLREQHRMSAALMAFPSEETYGGALRAHPAVAGRRLGEVLPQPRDREKTVEIDAPPSLFLDTAGKGFDEETEPGSESKRNPGEAALLVARVHELLAAGLAPSEMAVIVPYSAQATLVRDLLLAGPPALPPEVLAAVEVDTVDGFQGREKDAILLGLVRSNADGQLGFLTDLRRMNVALTRARRHLFVVGDSATLGAHPYYQRYIERSQAEGGYRSAWEWIPFVPPSE